MSTPPTGQQDGTTHRRAVIMEAALPVFLARGVLSTSIQDIQAATGLGAGSLYHWFPGGKAELVASLQLRILEEVTELYLGALLSRPHAADGIRTAISRFLTWVQQNSAHARFFLEHRDPQAAGITDTRIDELRRHFGHELVRWSRRATARGELRSVDPEVFAAILTGPGEGFARLWLERDRDLNALRRAAAQLGDMVVLALCPPEGQRTEADPSSRPV